MSDDIPTTHHVREALLNTYVESLDENFSDGWFDAWLAEERADAWESGLNTGISYGRVMHMGLPEPTNPYREE